MEIPRIVIMGQNITEKLDEIFKKINVGRKGVLVTGPGKVVEIANEIVKPIITKYAKVVFVTIESAPLDYNIIKKTYDVCKHEQCNFLISVGGGTAIDAGKLAASWAEIPFISFPTSAAHDGIASPAVSYLLRKKVQEKVGAEYLKVHAPYAIIADTEIISKAPRRLLISGFGDMIAKFTSVKDWQLAHRLRNEMYSEYAATMALMSARIVMENVNIIAKGDESAARIVTKTLIGSGVSMSIAGSSRPASGAEHLFSHALDLLSLKYGFQNALHGEQCAVGTIIASYLHGENWKNIQKLIKKVGGPTSAKDLNIEDKYVIEALTIAHTIRPERYTILGDKGITREAAINALKVTEIIE